MQAEDGIRDLTVTGVQTCALPICPSVTRLSFGVTISAWANAGRGRMRAAVRSRHESLGMCAPTGDVGGQSRSEEHTSELQSQSNLVCRLLLEKKKHDIYESLGQMR